MLCEYPVVQSPLARPTAADPRVAERFELYACGVELANGFGELIDPLLQLERLEEQMAEKARARAKPDAAAEVARVCEEIAQ